MFGNFDTFSKLGFNIGQVHKIAPYFLEEYLIG